MAQLLWYDQDLDQEVVPSGPLVLMRALEYEEASALRWPLPRTAFECAEVLVLALCLLPT